MDLEFKHFQHFQNNSDRNCFLNQFAQNMPSLFHSLSCSIWYCRTVSYNHFELTCHRQLLIFHQLNFFDDVNGAWIEQLSSIPHQQFKSSVKSSIISQHVYFLVHQTFIPIKVHGYIYKTYWAALYTTLAHFSLINLTVTKIVRARQDIYLRWLRLTTTLLRFKVFTGWRR